MSYIEDQRAGFYEILDDLHRRIGTQTLAICPTGRCWPSQGVYFFFEQGEKRANGRTARVVRVGTHAVSIGSKATLWKRLAQHRGTRAGSGNHRGSVFRRHLGAAMLRRGDGSLDPMTWGDKSKRGEHSVRERERPIEQAVSRYIGAMPFLWVRAEDAAGPESIRKYIERNSIALLSRIAAPGQSADAPSPVWLGQFSANQAVRDSGLWNDHDTAASYDRKFLACFERMAALTPSLGATNA